MPTGPKVTPDVVQRALKLQANGLTQQAIADELGLSRLTINRLLGKHNARAFSRLAAATASEKGRQVAVLNSMVMELLRDYQRSKENSKSIRRTFDDKGSVIREEKTVKREAGDTRFIEQARSALTDIRRILKLDLPEADAAAAGSESVTTSLKLIEQIVANSANGNGYHETSADAVADPGNRLNGLIE